METMQDAPLAPVTNTRAMATSGAQRQGVYRGTEAGVAQRAATANQANQGTRVSNSTRQPVDTTTLRRQPATVVDAARQTALEAYEF